MLKNSFVVFYIGFEKKKYKSRETNVFYKNDVIKIFKLFQSLYFNKVAQRLLRLRGRVFSLYCTKFLRTTILWNAYEQLLLLQQLIHQLFHEASGTIFSTSLSTDPQNFARKANTSKHWLMYKHYGNFRRFINNFPLCRKIAEGYWVVLLHASDHNLCFWHRHHLYNMWIIDTSYCNKQLSSRARKNHVNGRSVLMHFTKGEGWSIKLKGVISKASFTGC